MMSENQWNAEPNIVTKEALCNHSTLEPGGHKKKAFETPRPIPQATTII